MALNQSKVKMYRRCQKQFSFRYDYPSFLAKGTGLELIPKMKKLPLERGSWMHALQEALHHQWAGDEVFDVTFGEGKRKKVFEVSTWEELQQDLTDQFNQMFDEEKEDLGDLPAETARLFKSYLRFWDSDQDTYEVAEYEGKPMIEFQVEVALDKFGIKDKFKGKIDLVVQDHEYGGLWIWDAKWVKRIPPPDERMMSPQALLYVWALREKYGLPVRGFVFNYGRTKAPTIPRVLKRPAGMLSTAKKMDTDLHTFLGAVKDTHGDRWKEYLPYYAEKIKELKGRDALWFDRQRIPTEGERVEQALREFIVSGRQIQNRELERLSIPRSYFYNCRFSCDYHELCVAEFQGLNIDPLVKNNYELVPERYGREEEDLLAA